MAERQRNEAEVQYVLDLVPRLRRQREEQWEQKERDELMRHSKGVLLGLVYLWRRRRRERLELKTLEARSLEEGKPVIDPTPTRRPEIAPQM